MAQFPGIRSGLGSIADAIIAKTQRDDKKAELTARLLEKQEKEDEALSNLNALFSKPKSKLITESKFSGGILEETFIEPGQERSGRFVMTPAKQKALNAIAVFDTKLAAFAEKRIASMNNEQLFKAGKETDSNLQLGTFLASAKNISQQDFMIENLIEARADDLTPDQSAQLLRIRNDPDFKTRAIRLKRFIAENTAGKDLIQEQSRINESVRAEAVQGRKAPSEAEQKRIDRQVSNIIAIADRQPNEAAKLATFNNVLANPGISEGVKSALRGILPQAGQVSVEQGQPAEGVQAPSILSQNLERAQEIISGEVPSEARAREFKTSERVASERFKAEEAVKSREASKDLAKFKEELKKGGTPKLVKPGVYELPNKTAISHAQLMSQYRLENNLIDGLDLQILEQTDPARASIERDKIANAQPFDKWAEDGFGVDVRGGFKPEEIDPTPTPMPKTKDELIVGKTYQTARGLAVWDGTLFKPAGE